MRRSFNKEKIMISLIVVIMIFSLVFQIDKSDKGYIEIKSNFKLLNQLIFVFLFNLSSNNTSYIYNALFGFFILSLIFNITETFLYNKRCVTKEKWKSHFYCGGSEKSCCIRMLSCCILCSIFNYCSWCLYVFIYNGIKIGNVFNYIIILALTNYVAILMFFSEKKIIRYLGIITVIYSILNLIIVLIYSCYDCTDNLDNYDKDMVIYFKGLRNNKSVDIDMPNNQELENIPVSTERENLKNN